MKKSIWLLLVCSVFCFSSIVEAQKDDTPPLSRVREGGTPYNPNQSLEPYAIQLRQSLGPTSTNVASPPEYEPVKGVLYKYSSTAWPTVVRDLVVKLTQDPNNDEIAYVVVTSTSQRNSAINTFTAGGADMSKVEFLIHPSESIWMRDYGPHFVWENGTLTVADSHYYPTRPNDNFLPTRIGDDNFQMSSSDMGLYYSGGNFQPGPNRTGFITSLITLDNPVSQGFDDDLIAELYNKFQGIDTLHILPQLPFSVDGTGHIDMWMYLIDENTVVISEFINGSNPTAIEITNNAVTYMEDLGFTVYRPQAWNSGGVHYTYANAFRVNNRIFIPCYGTQLQPGGNPAYNDEDAFALQVWENAVAGKGIEIVPVQCISIIPASGAIHCIVKQVPRYSDPLPSATVQKPSADDLWIVGNPQTIRWSATDFDNRDVYFVQLEYSADDGNTWEVIAQVADTGSYEWTPTQTSNTARIKVQAYNDMGQSGEHVSDRFVVANGTETHYNFDSGGGTDKFVFGFQTSSWGFVGGNVNPVNSQISNADYDRMAMSDASGGDGDSNRYRSPTTGGSSESTHIIEFNLTEDISAISEVEVHWEGYADRCTQAEMYFWDHIAQDWGDGNGLVGQNRFADSWAGNRDGYLDGKFNEIDRYVGVDGKVIVLIYGERPGDETFHDFVSLSVKQAITSTVDVNAINVFRGTTLSGGLAEVQSSDDQYLAVQPGFTLTNSEAPVWIEFFGNSINGFPSSVSFVIESRANTPNLEMTVELFNHVTQSYEVIGAEAESFNNDSVTVIDAAGDVTRFVTPNAGVIYARAGWRTDGLVIVFPWTISIDQANWEIN